MRAHLICVTQRAPGSISISSRRGGGAIAAVKMRVSGGLA